MNFNCRKCYSRCCPFFANAGVDLFIYHLSINLGIGCNDTLQKRRLLTPTVQTKAPCLPSSLRTARNPPAESAPSAAMTPAAWPVANAVPMTLDEP